jgi:hypothetical protein
MSGAFPRRCVHSGVGISADITMLAPRGSSVIVFFFEESSAELTPARWAR